MPSLGEDFRSAREVRGVSYAEVGAEIHIRPALLEAIEAEEWRTVGDVTSLRGLLRTYARYLGLDGGAIVARFNAEVAPSLTPIAPPRRNVLDGQTMRAAVLGVCAIVAVCAVVMKVSGLRHFHHAAGEALVASDVETASPRVSSSPRPMRSATPASTASPVGDSRSPQPFVTLRPSPSVAPSAAPGATHPTPAAPSDGSARSAGLPSAQPVPTTRPAPIPSASPGAAAVPSPAATVSGGADNDLPPQEPGG